MSLAASTPDFGSTRAPAGLEMAKLMSSLVIRAVGISVAAAALLVSAAFVLS